ncbi:hypothetical protein Tsubulata_046629 [Turnera subulata]|uniref:Uncharacterized protein n=1 Tax=Turnera subulata TaxID=218843 RepID=A0A9Q0JQX4_9ROSI|nr:hypothetical protein Tsubulata_046629 [Turnera subulata]
MGSRGSLFYKVLFGVGIVGFVTLLLAAETLETEAAKARTVRVQGIRNLKHEVVLGGEKLVYNPELDLNFMMSKRKVPNGPDPIHNRRAGNSKRPPGRA